MNEVRSKSKGVNRKERVVWPFYIPLSVTLLVYIFALIVPSSVKAAVFNVVAGDVDGLRAAINQANTNGEDDEIHLSEGDYKVRTGLPSITSAITIIGTVDFENDVTCNISRDCSMDTFRIFHVAGTGSLKLINIGIRDGEADEGGGIFNLGTLEITHCYIEHNTAVEDGGGIYNAPSGTLKVTDSRISLNMAEDGGGIENDGGMVKIIGSFFQENEARGSGGGIRNRRSGHLEIRNSFVSYNKCGNDGGGIQEGTNDDAGTVMMVNSNVLGNEAGQDGGGISLENLNSQVTCINSTIGENTAHLAGGGFNQEGTVTLINCTVANNKALKEEGSEGGGGIRNNGPKLTKLQNTILANNTSPIGPDCHGDFITSLGNNLFGNTSGFTIIDGTDDLKNMNPRLGTIADFFPRHFPLLPNSPAIDKGTNDVFQNFPDTKADQLGRPRPADGVSDGAVFCDIGAIEFYPVVNNRVSEAKEKRETSYSPDCRYKFLGICSEGTFTIKATFTNTSNAPIVGPFFEVIELTGGNFLLNADGGPSIVGATLTPDVGADREVSPGESFPVVFEIGLIQTKEKFTFVVDLLGG